MSESYAEWGERIRRRLYGGTRQPRLVNVGTTTVTLNDRRGRPESTVELDVLAELPSMVARYYQWPDGSLSEVQTSSGDSQTVAPVGSIRRHDPKYHHGGKSNKVERHEITPERLALIEQLDPDAATFARRAFGRRR